jgi:hypothetical protein
MQGTWAHGSTRRHSLAAWGENGALNGIFLAKRAANGIPPDELGDFLALDGIPWPKKEH